MSKTKQRISDTSEFERQVNDVLVRTVAAPVTRDSRKPLALRAQRQLDIALTALADARMSLARMMIDGQPVLKSTWKACEVTAIAAEQLDILIKRLP